MMHPAAVCAYVDIEDSSGLLPELCESILEYCYGSKAAYNDLFWACSIEYVSRHYDGKLPRISVFRDQAFAYFDFERPMSRLVWIVRPGEGPSPYLGFCDTLFGGYSVPKKIAEEPVVSNPLTCTATPVRLLL